VPPFRQSRRISYIRLSSDATSVNRKLKKIAKNVSVATAALALAYFFPIPFVVFVMCGVWDVSRNGGLDVSVLKQYFLKNGITTWLASPINIGLDILALPYINKGVYKLSDLPTSYQAEINSLIRTAGDLDLVGRLRRKTEGLPRAMFFFKWYGRNVENEFDLPEFHADFKYIRTIGVSVFRERESTSRHFGPFRPSLRVLYCLNEDVGQDAYIRVGTVENHWRNDPLFIFDDTLLHQSFNETDAPRYCLWADIIRPSYVPFVFDTAVSIIRIIFRGMNGIFYKNWKLINN
jgi:aspartyl/asparaginyl beta-hydroxylase (cupin superfamily)